MDMYLLYKDFYEREQDLRHTYDNRTQNTIAIVSGFIAADIFLLNSAKTSLFWDATRGEVIKIWFIVLSITLAAQIVLSFLSYAAFRYRYLDFPVDLIQGDIDKMATELKLRQVLEPLNFEEELDSYTKGMLARVYYKCASKYYCENIRKRRFHHLCNLSTYANVIAIAVQFSLINL